jgi:large subunit ribosomal protein L17
MRHLKAGIKLNRTSSHRNAMFKNMVTSLFKYERIKTTDVKAKELRRWADKMITLAKRGDLHARRQALSIIREKQIVHKLFEEAAGRYGDLNGGYTRLIKIGFRAGDAASLTLVELVNIEEKIKKKEKNKKSKSKEETKAAKKEGISEKDSALRDSDSVVADKDAGTTIGSEAASHSAAEEEAIEEQKISNDGEMPAGMGKKD